MQWFLILVLVLVSSVANASCAARSDIVKTLRDSYNERPAHIGMISLNAIAEIWTSKKGKTWSFLITDTAGIACMVASGVSWEDIPNPDDEVDGPKI